jgi:nucleoside-diphosphate-sugar epimerase
MRQHLVTGGSGFLGNLIARRLLSRGESVRVIDTWGDESRPKEIEFVKGSVLDREMMNKVMQGIDIVHHCAALVPLTKSGSKFSDVNYTGSIRVAAIAGMSGVKAFIHMSSSAVYGRPNCPVTHAIPIRPAESYGRSKFNGEIGVKMMCENFRIPLIIIRPRTIIGEGRLGIFQMLFQWILENRRIPIIGHGFNRLQFVHAHDLMDFYMMALDSNRPGTYNVGTDRFGTVRQAIGNLIAAIGSKSEILSLPEWPAIMALTVLDKLRLSPLAPWHYLTYSKPFYFDVEPLLEMGWKPRYSNDEMLRESFEWFVKYRQTQGASPHRKSVNQRILNLLKAI